MCLLIKDKILYHHTQPLKVQLNKKEKQKIKVKKERKVQSKENKYKKELRMLQKVVQSSCEITVFPLSSLGLNNYSPENRGILRYCFTEFYHPMKTWLLVM